MTARAPVPFTFTQPEGEAGVYPALSLCAKYRYVPFGTSTV